jgi:hypothetical protein
METLEEQGLAALRPLAPPDCRRQDRATGQRQHDHEAGDRKAEPWPLAAWLGIRLLVGLRVRHGDPRAIHDLDRPSMPVPGRGHLLLEPLSALRHQARQQRLGKPLTRLAIPPSERGPRLQALGNACRIEPRDCRPAGGVVAVYLT